MIENPLQKVHLIINKENLIHFSTIVCHDYETFISETQFLSLWFC